MQKPCNKCENSSSYILPSGTTRYYPQTFGYYAIKCRECEKYKKYEEYLQSRRKYLMGKPIKSLEEYFALKEKGESLFYWRGAIRHFKVLECLTFSTFVDLINHGNLYRAIKKQ